MRSRRIVFITRRAISCSFPRALSGDSGENCSAIELDSSQEWLRGHIHRAVGEGRQTKESAAYFESIMSDQPEFLQCIRAAQDLIGKQDPRALSKYQQAHYADRLSNMMSGLAAERMMRAHAEESNTRRHTQEGTPTGENYWFEAGNTLSSPSVPDFVKDDILREMRKDRPVKSPAYDEPQEVDRLASGDDAFAEHLRHQRRRLLSADDPPV